MKYSRFFSILVLVSLGLYGAIGFYLLPYAHFTGDLTRIGMLPEMYFGAQSPQPAINPRLMKQASWQNADVLVVGDSFSEGRVWQSVLASHGLKVRTERWDKIREVCMDFEPWLDQQGFHGKFVIFEMVERNIPDFQRSVGCQHMLVHHSSNIDIPDITNSNPDYSGRLSIGIETALNTYNYDRASARPGFRQMTIKNGAKLVRLPNGCSLFSHLRCNDAIFFGADKSEDVPDSAIDNIKQLNGRLHKTIPVWVFVPNKSTAYLYSGKQFWNKIATQVNAPNLLQTFSNAIKNKTIDLYYGNNTHLSTNGYLLMGETIYQNIQHPIFSRPPLTQH